MPRSGPRRRAAERERAEREIEFADLYARHDRILREAGSLDGGDLVLELGKLLANRADVAAEVGDRVRHVLADELEDAGAAHRAVLEALGAHGNIVCACDPAQATRRFRGAGEAALEAFRAAHPDAAEIDLGGRCVPRASPASGAARTTAPRRRRSRARSSTCSPPARSGRSASA